MKWSWIGVRAAFLGGCVGASMVGSTPPPMDMGTVGEDALWDAVVMVESDGDAHAIGDGGLAVGVAQIQPIMVADCNRILGREVFTLEDRMSPALSRLMFDTFQRHYGAGRSLEWKVRAWNGGPTWHRREAARRNSDAYWQKVRIALEKHVSHPSVESHTPIFVVGASADRYCAAPHGQHPAGFRAVSRSGRQVGQSARPQ